MELFVDNLTVIDCSYLHPEYGVEGESWIVDVVLHGVLDAQGMVMDFGHVKKVIKHHIDATVDHALLVPMHSPHVTWIDDKACKFHYGHNKYLTHNSPPDALCCIETEAISSGSVASYLEATLMAVMPETVEKVDVTLRNEEMKDNAYYHYSHGLKKHDGNCQRIAHGHRSKIAIMIDGKRSGPLEAEWAEKWKHIYIGTREDITHQTDTHIHFAYKSGQGDFTLALPIADVYLIETESTVENIAAHMAQEIKHAYPEQNVSVRAYEGVQKGAIASL